MPNERTAEPRPRVPIPAWMQTWPRGVQPVSAYATTRGVELVYRAPADRWFRVVAALRQQPGQPFEVRAIPGPERDIGERLAKAVAHHLARSSAQARDWLTRARAWVEWLSSLRAFGGPGIDAALDRVLLLLDELRELENEHADTPTRIESTLAEAEAELGPERLAPLRPLLWLAAGDIERALAAWSDVAASLTARHDAPALACVATLQTLLGDIGGAQTHARALLELGRDAIDARHAGELLEHVGLREAAVEQLRIAAADADGDGGGYDAQRRLAVVALAAKQPEIAKQAAAHMLEQARVDAQHLDAAELQRDAGDFLAAETTLTRALAQTRSDTDAAPFARALASLRLWRGDHHGAAELMRPRCERAPDDAVAQRILGTAELLAARPEAALPHLARAIELDARDQEARLWQAAALQRLGRTSEARLAIREVTLGDHPVWQLLRALIEEQATPGSRTGANTWFIVDQNIRQLLGPDAPADSHASHTHAIAAIEQALARLAGNFSTRLTTPTPDGSLRWLDIASPRHRAEQLQFQASHRPVTEVLAAFEQLAAAHGDVPFFTTYPAELLLWRGDYQHAFERFLQIWQATRTRWGYVGAGAAAMLLGDDERALALWDDGKRHYAWLDAEATYCYRGELLLRRRQLDAARADLELAIRARPARLGAWVNLALLELAAGREAPLRAAVERIEQLCLPFAWEARREAKLLGPTSTLTPEALGDLLTTLRNRMRGNRSSVMYTIVDRNDVLRVFPVGPPQLWRDHARRALALQASELLRELSSARGL